MTETRLLPSWAQELVPVDMEGAALLLGIKRRFLVDVLAKHKHYEPRGNRKVFYPEHIALLREALQCPTNSGQNRAKAFSTPLEPSTEGAYEQALELATRKKPRDNVPSTKRSYGNVVPLAKRQSEHSKKRQ